MDNGNHYIVPSIDVSVGPSDKMLNLFTNYVVLHRKNFDRPHKVHISVVAIPIS